MAEQALRTSQCFAEGISKCSGEVKNGICEAHTLELFRIALR